MGKRIRHLEYYGYSDQNVYIGLPNMDLSDIHKTNRDQDRDISEISGATKDKADISTVNELSGKVDTFIDVQSHINRKLIGAVKHSFDHIDRLRKRDKEITDKINEIGDKFDPIYDQLGSVTSDVESIGKKLEEHLAESDSNTNGTAEKIADIEAALEEKVDKSEADELYAKKGDTYTKGEVDSAIADSVRGLASQEWVYSKGFITIDDADGRYANKTQFNNLVDRVNDVKTDLYDQYNGLNSAFNTFKTEANNRIDIIYGRVDTLEKKHDREIGNLQNKDEALQEQINTNKAAIKEINDVSLPNKVDKVDFNTLKDDVDKINKKLDTKVDITDYERDKANFGNSLDRLDDKKADKTALNEVNESLSKVARDIVQEVSDRTEGDKALKRDIDSLSGKINDIVEDNLERDDAMSNLKDLLDKELKSREDADDKIVGSENDKADSVSLYGVKKYAEQVANSALAAAKSYTDMIDSNLRVYIDDMDHELEVKISANASKAYVDSIRSEMENSITSKIASETERAENAEAKLTADILNERNMRQNEYSSLTRSLSDTANIVAAVTSWSGSDPNEYTDEGNGILDVLHRELHSLRGEVAELKKKLDELEK